MKITLKDCLELDIFKNYSKVIAGYDGLDRKVKGVSVLDAVDRLDAVKGNGKKEELVITSFDVFENYNVVEGTFLEELNKMNISALVLLSYSEDEVIEAKEEYRGFLEKADKIRLPIIEIQNSNIGYSDILSSVMNEILFGEHIEKDLINDSVFQLMNFKKYPEFVDAVTNICKEHNLNITIISEEYNKVSEIGKSEELYTEEIVKIIKERKGKEREGEFRPFEYNFKNYGNTFFSKVSFLDNNYFLVIEDEKSVYNWIELRKFAEILELTAKVWKFVPEKDYKADIVKAMLRGNKNLVISFSDILGLGERDLISVFLGKNVNKRIWDDEILYFEEKTGYKIYRLEEEDRIYGLIVKETKNNHNEEEKHNKPYEVKDYSLEEIQEVLGLYEDLKNNNSEARVFHYTGINNISEVVDAYKLILDTFSYVEDIFPYKRSFSRYEMMMVLNSLTINNSGEYVKNMYLGIFDLFNQRTCGNKVSQLLLTFETFVLDAGMNSNKTAEILNIHVNTVQYRLKKINDILGVEITGNRVIPGLTIALALYRLVRKGNKYATCF